MAEVVGTCQGGTNEDLNEDLTVRPTSHRIVSLSLSNTNREALTSMQGKYSTDFSDRFAKASSDDIMIGL